MSKEDDAIIQAVAQAINEAGQGYLRDCADQYAGWADIPESVFAKAAIAAVRKWDAGNGFVTVAKGVTQAMQDAGVLALREPSGRPGHIVSRVYREAVDASPTPPGAE